MTLADGAVGIDLGTSNSVVAVAAQAGGAPVVVPLAQVVGVGQVGERPALPSAWYLPAEGEFGPGAVALPWDPGSAGVVGHFARDHGALRPERLVTSAKSWLCHGQVDRRAPLLPWKAEAGIPTVSPLAATERFLAHLRAAAEAAGTGPLPGGRPVVLTVPASFDAVARELTHEAAATAGWGDVVLLEEPQAAFYAWLERSGPAWRTAVRPGDLILVCDVGGGTSDFTLIAVGEREGDLDLTRVAVGEHLLLGGDNLDLALAHAVRAGLEGEGGAPVDPWQFRSLVHQCRRAKEELFGDPARTEAALALPSRSARLLASTRPARLTRETLEKVVLEGFFPLTRADEFPARRATVGLQEFGLAYAAEPALSRHLARFLQRARANVVSSTALAAAITTEAAAGPLLRPTAVLFNGGVFNAAPLRRRILDLLASWQDGVAPRELEGAQPDLAVALGAAAYGRIRAGGRGVRIRAGAARSYYLGLEASALAVPGLTPPVHGVCVVPQGMEEGSERTLSGQTFGLVVGEPVEFRFFSSSVRAGDVVGAIVPDAERDLEETSRLRTVLPAGAGEAEGDVVPVQLHSRVTETGTLALFLRHEATGRDWKLEFEVRTT